MKISHRELECMEQLIFMFTHEENYEFCFITDNGTIKNIGIVAAKLIKEALEETTKKAEILE